MISCLREPISTSFLGESSDRCCLHDAVGAPEDTFWYASGRSALFQALRALALPAGSGALMPAYVAAGVIDPLRALSLRVHFYGTGRDLLVAPEDIRAALVRDGSIRLVVLIHPMGKPQPIEPVVEICRERGVLLVEDCAQALFCTDASGRALGTWGDIALFSLTKHLGLAEGAAVVIRNPALARPVVAHVRTLATRTANLWYRLHLYATARMHRARRTFLARRWLAASGRCYVRYYRTCSRDFRPLSIARSTQRQIRRVQCRPIVSQRRAHVEALYREVHSRALEWVFPHDSPGWVPMAVPAFVTRGDRRALVERAMGRGVFLASLCDLWNFLPSGAGFANERTYLDRHVLVPVNEQITAQDMQHIVWVLNEL